MNIHIYIFFHNRRDPKCLVKPIKSSIAINETDDNKLNEAYEAKKPKAVRHLILIRHGQYNLDGKTDAERILTELGENSLIFFCLFPKLLLREFFAGDFLPIRCQKCRKNQILANFE